MAIPTPSLAGLHPRVSGHIQAQRELLAESIANSRDPREIARSYGVAGQTYHTYGFLEAAEACYLNAQRLNNDDYRWSYYLGRIYRQQGRLDKAVAQLRRSLASRPDYAPAAISLADLLRETNRAREAATVLDRILEAQPDHAMAHYVLGQVLLDLGESDQAARNLQIALAAQPGATRVHYLLATAYRDIGDLGLAQAHLKRRGEGRIRFTDPLMSELARLNRGVQRSLEAGAVAFGRGDYGSAVRHFREAATVDPENTGARRAQNSALLAEAHRALGLALVKLGNTREAETHYREAIRLNPRLVAAHYDLALLQDSLGHFEEAILGYEQVVNIEPLYRDARSRLAADLERLGRCEEALGHLQQLPESARDGKPLSDLRARCLVQRGPAAGD